MSNIKKNERYIPIKNYVLAAVIVVVIVLLTWYGFSWYNVIQENKVSKSYLVKEKVISNEIKSLKEVNDIFSEAPSSYYIYISYTGSEEVYNMEKDLKKIISEYNLNNSIYYLNVTSIKDEDDYINQINKALSLAEVKVTNVPTIIYYKEGKAVDIISREDDNIMNVGDFQKLLDVNNIEKE